MLLARDLITKEQLRVAIEHQRTSDRRIGQLLIDLGFTTADAVPGALSVQLGVPAARLNGFTVSASAVQALPEKLARKHLVVPLQKIGVILQVAIASPNDLAALDDLRFASDCQDDTSVLIEAVSIERRANERADRRLSFGRRVPDAELAEDVFDEATEQTAVRAVDRILSRAAAAGASDIHLERTPDSLRVRFRVDGTFQDISYLS